MAVKQEHSEIVDTVTCCVDHCNLSSKVKVKTAYGWANFCLKHYYENHQKGAEEYCNAMGLNTTAERIAWLKKHAAGITKRYTGRIPASREPGTDYEEDAA